MLRPEDRCAKCGTSRRERPLAKCPICHRFFCRICEVRQQGKRFCSAHCADYFYFGDEDSD